MIFITISQVVELHNRLNSMTTEELWTLADELEIETYWIARDDVLAAIVDTLQCIAWSINEANNEK
jgi:hypothetical protein